MMMMIMIIIITSVVNYRKHQKLSAVWLVNMLVPLPSTCHCRLYTGANKILQKVGKRKSINRTFLITVYPQILLESAKYKLTLTPVSTPIKQFLIINMTRL
jgi:hypothetical protein